MPAVSYQLCKSAHCMTAAVADTVAHAAASALQLTCIPDTEDQEHEAEEGIVRVSSEPTMQHLQQQPEERVRQRMSLDTSSLAAAAARAARAAAAASSSKNAVHSNGFSSSSRQQPPDAAARDDSVLVQLPVEGFAELPQGSRQERQQAPLSGSCGVSCSPSKQQQQQWQPDIEQGGG
jgi:hypothetical protein